MAEVKQRTAAKKFVEDWTGKGYEKGESQKFWIQLLGEVLGVEHSAQFISFEDQVHLDHTSFIDGYIPATKVLIEQKSVDKDLNKAIKQSDGSLLNPFQQAKRYITELPLSQHPRWVVTCNFQKFCVYDMERPNGEPQEILLKDLEKDYYRLSFLVDTGNEHLRKEMEVSIKAGEIVGLLYEALLKQYKNSNNEESLKSLNILCVRLVFCLYAEDAGIFGKHDMFLDYLRQYDASKMRKALIELFEVLNTKPEDRDPYLEDDLKAFPYVNGGLFAQEHIEIPQFTDEIRELLLEKASADFDWSEISPTIFGAVFESTLNPETRRSGGMHYTSIENIHKVIDPLFLDDLNKEFEEIKALPQNKNRDKKFEEFQDKIANLNFLDPACGSGNFLTETYISLRKLENEVLYELQKGQITMGLVTNPIKVSIKQFYGIEINDFAVTVAKTALWIAESQMMKKTEDIVHMDLDFLPLKTYVNIVEGNALRINWEDVISKDKLNYIMGNPPFVGYSLQTKEQKNDILSIYVDEKGKSYKTAGKIDYVAGWYFKAAEMMSNIPSPLVGEGRGEGLIKASHYYTKKSLEYSKELRKNMTPAEQILWYYLRNRQLAGLKFRRQEAFDKYILDFVCFEKKLVIELDGGGHLEDKQKEHDIERDKFIEQNGYKVLRIYNNEVINNIEGVIEYILQNIETPHPNPLPQGAREIRCALVSTNSITQGEQVAGVWKPLYERFGIHIDFAHRTFRWDSESNSKAHVHCVIVGFSCIDNKNKRKLYSNERMQLVDNINAYLIDAPNVFIESCNTPICKNVTKMLYGNKPTDGGHLFLTQDEYEEFIIKEPEIKSVIKKCYGAEEFINNKIRYCLWLHNVSPTLIRNSKLLTERLEKVRDFRLASSKEATRKTAETPSLFQEIRQPNSDFLIVPRVSSENRRYVPMGFEHCDVIVNDAIQMVPNATLYDFGVLESNVHMAWMRAVCGRLEMRYRYSKDIVYNNFPWCNPTDEQKAKIEKTAQGILDARALYPDCSLADLYDELTMPPELRRAHQENDKAVMEAYGFRTTDETTGKPRWLNESETVAKLMEMYESIISDQ